MERKYTNAVWGKASALETTDGVEWMQEYIKSIVIDGEVWTADGGDMVSRKWGRAVGAGRGYIYSDEADQCVTVNSDNGEEVTGNPDAESDCAKAIRAHIKAKLDAQDAEIAAAAKAREDAVEGEYVCHGNYPRVRTRVRD